MTAAPTLARSVIGKIRQLASDERGVSAVEFAMLLPLMLTLYLGTVELSQGIGASRKVTLTARTVTDLVAQSSTMSATDMTNSFSAATAVIAPYSTANLKVTVSSVVIDGAGKATVGWSCGFNSTARGKGSAVTLPSALVVNNSSLIWGEVQYNYKPTIGYVISGTLTLHDQIYMRPRLTDTVTGPSSC